MTSKKQNFHDSLSNLERSFEEYMIIRQSRLKTLKADIDQIKAVLKEKLGVEISVQQ